MIGDEDRFVSARLKRLTVGLIAAALAILAAIAAGKVSGLPQ